MGACAGRKPCGIGDAVDGVGQLSWDGSGRVALGVRGVDAFLAGIISTQVVDLQCAHVAELADALDSGSSE